MVRETHGVPSISRFAGNRHTDARLFPEIAGIAEVAIPLHGSPRAKAFAACGYSHRMHVDLAVRRTGLPERWLEGLALEIVEARCVLVKTALCRILEERLGSDGYVHLRLHSYPIEVSGMTFGPDAEIVLKTSSGHEWRGSLAKLLRAA